MTCYEKWQLGIQILIAVALIATFIVFLRQLCTMSKQLETDRKTAEVQNILTIAGFLQVEDVRMARTQVIQNLENINYDQWSESQKQAASKVCSSYATAGIILKTKMVPLAPIIENWGPSIRRCYGILKPHIDAMKKPDKGGSEFWSAFDWLYEQANTLSPTSTDANSGVS